MTSGVTIFVTIVAVLIGFVGALTMLDLRKTSKKKEEQ